MSENMFNDGLGGCVVSGCYLPENEARELWEDGIALQESDEIFNQYPILKSTSQEIKAFSTTQKIEYVKQSIQCEIACNSETHPMQVYWAVSGNEWDYFDYLAEN